MILQPLKIKLGTKFDKVLALPVVALDISGYSPPRLVDQWLHFWCGHLAGTTFEVLEKHTMFSILRSLESINQLLKLARWQTV